MARSKRIKETAAGVAYYHVISRTNNKVFLFGSAKTEMKDDPKIWYTMRINWK